MKLQDINNMNLGEIDQASTKYLASSNMRQQPGTSTIIRYKKKYYDSLQEDLVQYFSQFGIPK